MRASRAAVLAAAGVFALAGCAQMGSAARRVTNRGQIVAQPACRDFSFPIYFETGSDRLTRDALQLIGDSAARVAACKVAEVQVTGLADADGSAERNLELSRRRALVVTQALATRGYPTPRIDMTAAGETGAVTAAGEAPLRRRTEVSVRFASTRPTT